jgi:DNA polymerase IV
MTERTFIHLDMDAFYASVEQRDCPALRGKPVIVGGDTRRGVVCAASYEARPFGVRSAMPMAQALKLAPKAIVIAPRMGHYAAVSDAVFAVFGRYTPLIEPLSLDEAFLDVTASRTLFGDGLSIAKAIRAEIAQTLQLPCSAGVSDRKFVAKILSDAAKPNGQREVLGGQVLSFLAPLPVAKLWGVGPRTLERCHALGLRRIGDVAQKSEAFLVEQFGKQGQRFFQLSRGIDTRGVQTDREAKSLSAQETFSQDVTALEVLQVQLQVHALALARRLRRAQLKAGTVSVGLRDSAFSLRSKQHQLDSPSDDGQTLYREGAALLEKLHTQSPIRMLSLSCTPVSSATGQGSLFENEVDQKKQRINAAIDKLEAKFGPWVVRPASIDPKK